MTTLTDKALICAFNITENGTAKSLASNELPYDALNKSWQWVHLDRTAEETAPWLCDIANISRTAANALLAEETRPGIKAFSDGHAINLRGVNLNSTDPDEEMVAIRLWVTSKEVVTMRRYKLMAIQDIRDKYETGKGPASIGAFVADLCNGLALRISKKLNEIEDNIDELEEKSIECPTAEERNTLMNIRRKAIPLKRFLNPQRDALEELSRLEVDWLNTLDKEHIREAYHHVSRMIETLDAIRERAALLHEEMSNRSAEIANNNTYVLTIVAAIFLPLGFLTGLLGINVAGLPGTDNPWAFAIVCLLMIIIGVIEIIILKWLKWI